MPPRCPIRRSGSRSVRPYALTPLDPALEAVFKQQFTQGAGAFGSLVGVGGRTVTQDGALVGYVFVIGFPAGMLNAAAYQAMLTGMEPGMGVTFKTETISGVDVSTGTSAMSNVAVVPGRRSTSYLRSRQRPPSCRPWPRPS